VFADWATQLRYTPPWEFHGLSGYPPGYLVVLLAIGRLYGLIAPHFADPGGLLLVAMLKFPSILMDIVDAWIVWGIARCVAPRAALAAGIVWLFNPVAWIGSTFWGQIDSICWGFALAAILLMLLAGRDPRKTSARFAWAWFCLGISFLIKPVAAPLLLVLVVYVAVGRAGTLRQRLGGTALGIAAAGVLTWAVVALFSGVADPIRVARLLLEQLTVHSVVGTAVSYTSVNAYNAWSVLLPFYVSDSLKLGGISLATIGAVLTGVTVLVLLARFVQLRGERAFVECAMLTIFAVFLLSTRMHERYVDGAVMLSVALIGLGPEFIAFAAIFTLTTSLDTVYGLQFVTFFDRYAPHAPLPATGVNLGDFWPAVSHPASLVNVMLFAAMFWMYVRPRSPQPVLEPG